MLHKRIDLDGHVVTSPISFSQCDKWGRLDGAHHKGIDLYKDVDKAFERLGRLFEGEQNYYFQLTPSGCLAMEHLFLHFYTSSVCQTGKNQFLTLTTEEAPILKTLDKMEMMGCGVKWIDVDSCGRIDLDALCRTLGPKTALISFSAVCAMTGIVQPVEQVIEICHSRGVKVHLNISHALGAWGVSLKEWAADYITFDADKIGGFQGIGGLFSKEIIKEGVQAPAFFLHLVAALEQKLSEQESFAMEAARRRQVFEQELLLNFPDCEILGKEVTRVPHILAVSFPGIMNEALLYKLYQKDIEASIGGGQFQTLNYLLKKWGKRAEVGLGAVSMAFSAPLQEEELVIALSEVTKAVHILKKMRVDL